MSYTLLSSGSFGAQFLEYVEIKPNLVITSSDTFGGRGMTTRIPTPIKTLSQQLKIPIQEIDEGDSFRRRLLTGKNQVVIVVDFGMILPKTIVEVCRYGIWNIHPSLLPHYRGPTPIQSALINGEKITGVSIISIDELIDHGPLLNLPDTTPACHTVSIGLNDTNTTLITKLAKEAGKLITLLMSNPVSSTMHMHQQEHNKATYTHRFEKKDGYLPFEELSPYLQTLFDRYNLTHLLAPHSNYAPFCTMQKAYALHDKIRALNPWPGVFSTLPNGKHIKIISSKRMEGNMAITQVQIEGKIYR
ncbi:MAG: methionyl-tRNA formyltransferase [Candidatus Roizmanbacteria bacterium]|nr:methionyl-tRNA formyltransferase [Candidatus Roizmanbacteria bacterium]